MKRPGRKRRAAGWTLLVLGLLVVAVWGMSGWGMAFWKGSHWDFFVSRGTFTAYWQRGNKVGSSPGVKAFSGYIRPDCTTPPVPDADAISRISGWNTWIALYYTRATVPTAGIYSTSAFSVALLPLSLVLGASAALLLRSGIVAQRRAITGRCKTCGYDLAGLVADVSCPECGKGSK